MAEDIRKYMTLSISIVALLIVVTNAKGFSTAIGAVGDAWTGQLKALQGR